MDSVCWILSVGFCLLDSRPIIVHLSVQQTLLASSALSWLKTVKLPKTFSMFEELLGIR